MAMRLALLSFAVEDEAVHRCCLLPQSQTHSALQTLYSSDLALKLKLMAATLAAVVSQHYAGENIQSNALP